MSKQKQIEIYPKTGWGKPLSRMLLPFILVLVCWAFACAVQTSMSKLLSAAAFSQVGNDMQQLVRSVSRSSETNETTVGCSSLGRLKYVEILINIVHCLIMQSISISWLGPTTIRYRRYNLPTSTSLCWTSPRNSSWADQVAHSQKLASPDSEDLNILRNRLWQYETVVMQWIAVVMECNGHAETVRWYDKTIIKYN